MENADTNDRNHSRVLGSTNSMSFFPFKNIFYRSVKYFSAIYIYSQTINIRFVNVQKHKKKVKSTTPEMNSRAKPNGCGQIKLCFFFSQHTITLVHLCSIVKRSTNITMKLQPLHLTFDVCLPAILAYMSTMELRITNAKSN